MADETLAAGVRLGPYEIVELVGTGGMGEVYRARDTRLDRSVAIKILPSRLSSQPGRRERFAREARVLANLNHKHIRAVYDVRFWQAPARFESSTLSFEGYGADIGVEFLVMEYLDGETLDRYLARKTMPLSRAMAYAAEIADALDAAHRHGVIHGDVKPANIMLTSSGVKLLDFGIARLVASTTEPHDKTVTDDQAIAGTTPYMAPEQFEGVSDDPRSDLFALGVVLYQTIAGRLPFEGASRARVMAAILEHEPEPLTSPNEAIPAALEHLVMKCLAKDPRDRWQTARDLSSELAWIARSTTPVAPPAPAIAAAPPPNPAPARRWRMPAPLSYAASAILAAAAIGAVVMTAWRVLNPLSQTGTSPVRFVVESPLGSPMSVAPGAFAISPDGSRLAFVAPDATGTRSLWLRTLDAFETHPIQGTADAWNPFWSPDSQSIAFTAGGKLRRVDLAADRVSTIGDITAAGYGAWSPDGTIVFSIADRTNALVRVPAAGGTPEPLSLPSGLRGAAVTGPEFLPDGRTFVYHARTASTATTGVYLASLDGGTHRLLMQSDSQAAYAEPGYLLTLAAGTLVARPFDARRRVLTGAAVALPEVVSFVPGLDRAAFSISRQGVLVYRARIDTSTLTWLDRVGRPIGSLGTGAYINPALSPDGARVAITRGDPQTAQSDIWIVDAYGSARQLTSTPGVENFPVWSPDGSRVLFASDRNGAMSLYQKDANADAGDPDEPLVVSNDAKIPFDWSRDGRFLLFASFDGRGMMRPRLWVQSLPGSVPTTTEIAASSLGQGDGQLQISPDGRWVAYASDVAGSPQVFVRPFPNGPGRWLISTAGGVEPKWRADGRELFYLASDQMLMSAQIGDGPVFTASPVRPLFRSNLVGAYLGSPYPNGRVRNEYAVSPDGQRFLIAQPAGGPSAYALRVVVNWPALLTR